MEPVGVLDQFFCVEHVEQGPEVTFVVLWPPHACKCKVSVFVFTIMYKLILKYTPNALQMFRTCLQFGPR